MRSPVASGPVTEEPRVLMVSGKGGTGKTTVAAGLAVAAVRRGLSVLLLELEGRAGAAPLLGVEPAGSEESPTPLGFSLASVGPREALLEYLGLFYGVRRIAGPLLRSRAVETVTEVAPGFRDLMLAGKVYETGEWRRRSPRAKGRAHYDLVVADAPPSGQIVPFLSAAGAFAELLRVGRAAQQAGRIDAFLRRRARVVLVTTAEELPVAETLETHAAIRDLGQALAPVVVNRVLPPVAPSGLRRAVASLDAGTVTARAREAGLALSRSAAEGVVAVVHGHARTEAGQRRQIRRLEDLPRVEVPALMVPSFGPAEVETVAAHLESVW